MQGRGKVAQREGKNKDEVIKAAAEVAKDRLRDPFFCAHGSLVLCTSRWQYWVVSGMNPFRAYESLLFPTCLVASSTRRQHNLLIRSREQKPKLGIGKQQ